MKKDFQANSEVELILFRVTTFISSPSINAVGSPMTLFAGIAPATKFGL